jgi:hypothetical protein
MISRFFDAGNLASFVWETQYAPHELTGGHLLFDRSLIMK